ncbi:hypothetical protein Mapa_006200 [Marchantia paleacea]|nr:hypothetical protein Mapa_006200 [Marchantia paleacea]
MGYSWALLARSVLKFTACVCRNPVAEVTALSPTTLMATNKGFQRDQHLQLHRRGHHLPWKLRQRTSTEIRQRVYICPQPTFVQHDPSRGLGDLMGMKKHFC